MKKIFSLVLTAVVIFSLVACGKGNATTMESDYTKELMKQASLEVGMPNITEFYEKKMAKEIFEKRDDSDLVCYVYSQNLNGKFVYVGKSIGYGLPYSTQYTQPETYQTVYTKAIGTTGEEKDYYTVDKMVLPQADPNGLYSPEGLSATWLMMINEENGEP